MRKTSVRRARARLLLPVVLIAVVIAALVEGITGVPSGLIAVTLGVGGMVAALLRLGVS